MVWGFKDYVDCMKDTFFQYLNNIGNFDSIVDYYVSKSGIKYLGELLEKQPDIELADFLRSDIFWDSKLLEQYKEDIADRWKRTTLRKDEDFSEEEIASIKSVVNTKFEEDSKFKNLIKDGRWGFLVNSIISYINYCFGHDFFDTYFDTHGYTKQLENFDMYSLLEGRLPNMEYPDVDYDEGFEESVKHKRRLYY